MSNSNLLRIRIGKTITVAAKVLIGGEAESLETRTLTVFLINPRGIWRQITGWTLTGEDTNKVTFTWQGTDQRVLGTYRLVVYENYEGENQSVLDRNILTLVPYSSMETNAMITSMSDVEVDVDLGSLTFTGPRGYTPYVQDGYWYINGVTTGIRCDYSSEEALRVSAENARVLAEQRRVNAESARVLAEDARVLAEQARVAAEAARVRAEQGRVSAEALRVSAEDARVLAEQARVTAEAARVRAEQGRVTAFENQMAAQQTTFEGKMTDIDTAVATLMECEATLTALQTEVNEIGAETIYDISAHNNGTTYASLSAALAAIPAADRVGGMSIRYIDSTTSRYVQYRFMSNNLAYFFDTNWEGVEDNCFYPITGIASSKGVIKEVSRACTEIGTVSHFEIVGSNVYQQRGIMYMGDTVGKTKIYIKCTEITCSTTAQETLYPYLRFFNASGERIQNTQLRDYIGEFSYDIPNNAASYQVLFFTSIIGSAIEGAVYSIDCGVWFDTSFNQKIGVINDNLTNLTTRVNNDEDILFANLESRDVTTKYADISLNAYIDGQGNIQSMIGSTWRVLKYKVHPGDIIHIKAGVKSAAAAVWWATYPDIDSINSNNKIRVSETRMTTAIDDDVIIQYGEGCICIDWNYPEISIRCNNIEKPLLSERPIFTFVSDGDSITAGNQWSYYVAKNLGFSSFVNLGVGSAKWADKKITYDEVEYTPQIPYDPVTFVGFKDGDTPTSATEAQQIANNCARLHLLKYIYEVKAEHSKPYPDVFAVSFGTNDYATQEQTSDAAIATGHNYPDGQLLYSMTGAMKWYVQKLLDEFPSCKVFVLSPIQSSNESRNSLNVVKSRNIKNITDFLSCEFIDMYNRCGISYVFETGNGRYLSDGLHPNDAGKKVMGKYASAIIKQLTEFL